jgi:hypothetical protein
MEAHATDTNVVMHPDGRITPIAPKNGTEYTLEELQGFVGGYIELVPMSKGRYAVVNEEGMYLGLGVNPGASLLLGMTVVGPVVVVPRKAMGD